MAGEISPKLQGSGGQKREIISYSGILNGFPTVFGANPGNGRLNITIGSIAIGDGSYCLGNYSLAIGTPSTNATLTSAGAAATPYCYAIGSGAAATGQGSIAFGYLTIASGANSIAIGYTPQSTGSNSIAVGNATTSSNTNSIAVGFNATASTVSSIAMGANSTASAGGIAIGTYQVNGGSGIAIGTLSSGNYNAAGTSTVSLGWSQTGNNNQLNCILINSGGSQGSGMNFGTCSNSIVLSSSAGSNYSNQNTNAILMGTYNWRLFGQITQIGTNMFGSASAQPIKLYAGNQTTNATQATLYLNYSTNTQLVTLLTSSITYFKARIIGKVTGASDAGSWEITGVVQVGATAGTALILGTPTNTTIGTTAGAAAWSVTATANTSNPSIDFKVTGAASTTIRWFAEVELLELIY